VDVKFLALGGFLLLFCLIKQDLKLDNVILKIQEPTTLHPLNFSKIELWDTLIKVNKIIQLSKHY